MSQAKSQSLKQAHKHWAKLRVAVQVAGAFKSAVKTAAANVAEKEELRNQLQAGNLNQPLLAANQDQKDGDDNESTGEKLTNMQVTIDRLRDSPVNTLLLVFVPIGIMAGRQGWAPWQIFWLNFMALIPISGYLGQATEDISSYTSEVIAGLLNATFGNIVEMMVAVAALCKRDIVVVQSTLLGSILSNLLFVLGSCFLYGGCQVRELNFSSKASSTCTSLLLLATMSLVLPTAMHSVMNENESADYDSDAIILQISRYSSVVIFCMYIQFLYFQLVSHKDYFDDADGGDDGDEEPKWTPAFAVFVLAVASVMTACTADYLVDSIHGYAADMQLNKSFIGLILVASVGNIPEFYVTLMVAKNNKLDLALTIAVGSSCQMALLVTPFAVLSGWYMDVPMSLDFHMLQIICLLLAVLTVSSVIQSGSATWLHGSLLVGSYIIIAMLFYFLPIGVGGQTA